MAKSRFRRQIDDLYAICQANAPVRCGLIPARESGTRRRLARTPAEVYLMMSLERGVPHMADLAGPTSSVKRSSRGRSSMLRTGKRGAVLSGLLHADRGRVIYHDAWPVISR